MVVCREAPKREFFEPLFFSKRSADEVFFLGSAGSGSLLRLLPNEFSIDELGCRSGVVPFSQEPELCGGECFSGVDEEVVKFCWKADCGKKKLC